MYNDPTGTFSVFQMFFFKRKKKKMVEGIL